MENENITFGIPEKEDYPRIAEICDSEYPIYATVMPPEELEMFFGDGYPADPEEIMEGRKTRNHFIAERDGRIAGFVSWYRKPNGIV